MMMRKPTRTMAVAMSVRLTHGGSSRARRILTATRSFSLSSAGTAPHPALEEVDEDQHGERDEEEDDRDCGRLAVGELLEPRHDQDRGDLRLVRHVAGHEDDRAVFADRAGEG